MLTFVAQNQVRHGGFFLKFRFLPVQAPKGAVVLHPPGC